MKRAGPSIGNGIRKMYLIDPKHLRVDDARSDMPRTEVEIPQFETSAASSSLLSQQQQSLQRRITSLDVDMDRILNDRSLGDDEKLRRYLETLRKHIIGSKQLERLVREPMPVTIIDNIGS